MNQDNLDKFIKNKVGHHETPTDPDLLWQKIQAKQKGEKKRKRRFLVFWFMGAGLLLPGLAFLITPYFLEKSESGNIDDSIIIENTSKINAPAENKDEAETETINLSEAEKEISLNENIAASLNSNMDEKESKDILGDNTAGESMEKDFMIAEKNASNKKTVFNSIEKISQEGGFTPFKDEAINFSEPVNDEIVNEESVDFSVYENEAGSDRMISENIDDVILGNEKNESIEKATQDSAQSSLFDLSIDEENDSDLVSENNFISEKMEIDSSLNAQQKDENNTPENKGSSQENNWIFSNGASFTYGKTRRNLSARNSASADYLEIRDDSETSLDAVRANLDFMIQHQSGFYIKSGLEYQQINERFEFYAESDSVTTNPNQVLAISFDINGTRSETIGNGDVKTTHWVQKKIYNHYRTIDVPLLLGYRSLKEVNSLGWFVEGGASINIWFNADGEIVDADSQLYDLKNNAGLFKSRTGVSLMGGAGATYKIADRFSIWASPEIRYNLSSITSDENTLSQKYMNVGFRMGLRYFWSI